ncbi:7295_t:CDS:2 [Ambispora leptoticha]|uniref:7295_t:CDS:1 n=1 Tax=Ambispora leptoticha TaxID=144679 RepID=A0A9N9F6U6_9GLOM|nr:7295_t:CDS:2 [Ambispora leptoticha]
MTEKELTLELEPEEEIPEEPEFIQECGTDLDDDLPDTEDIEDKDDIIYCSNTNQTNEQKQINSQSVPIFSNVDLTASQFGGFQRQQQLATKQTEQGQNISAGSSNRTTAKQNLTSKEFYRQNKDANVSITKQDAYELNSMKKLDGGDELKILLKKTEKEYNKLPDTSNRKPRIALRLKVLEGCIKAYEPEYIELPTPEEFLARIKGEVVGYTRVIGYENIIEIVAKYLKSYHFAKKYGTPPPAQLMIMLLGEPGLGKTYISQAIAKALGRGFHMIGMNGKLNASLITGTNIENPGAEPGEVLKAISRREDRGCVIVFDEIEKAARECKEACGIPTDITTNKNYQDTFLDFPSPTNECIFIATVNRPEDVPNFVADRFAIRVEVLPLAYQQRLEVVRVVLQSELKKLEPAFEKIYRKK